MKNTTVTFGSVLFGLFGLMSQSAEGASFGYTDPLCVSFTSNTSSDGSLGITCNRAPVSTVPQCTLLASLATIPAGGQSTLSAACSPVATSYAWTNVATTGSGATVSPSTTTTYTVRGSNSQGPGNVASATVAVTAAPPVPQCALAASPSTLNAPGWVILTASCSPAATSYSWSNITGSSSSVYVTSTTTYSVRGSNAQGVGNNATTTVTVGTAPVPTPPLPTPPPATCGNLSVKTQALDWLADNRKAFIDYSMGRGEARIYSFKTGVADAAVVAVGVAEYAGFPALRTLTVSERPCDFSINDPAVPSVVSTSGTVFFTVGIARRGYQTLKANTVYYANFKNEDALRAPGVDSCPVGVTCSYTFVLAH